MKKRKLRKALAKAERQLLAQEITITNAVAFAARLIEEVAHATGADIQTVIANTVADKRTQLEPSYAVRRFPDGSEVGVLIVADAVHIAKRTTGTSTWGAPFRANVMNKAEWRALTQRPFP